MLRDRSWQMSHSLRIRTVENCSLGSLFPMSRGQGHRHCFSALSWAVNYKQRVLQWGKVLMRAINTFSTCAPAVLDIWIQNLFKVIKLYIKLKVVVFKVKFDFPSNLHKGSSTNREWAHKKDNSGFYWLYTQPPTILQCPVYCYKRAFQELQTIWLILRHFKGFNLLIYCNNHLYKCFNFINFVTLAYIIRDSLRTIYKHRNM